MATVTIKQSKNETIHVYTPQKNGEVEIIADNGYIAGTPNTKNGTITRNITIKFKDE
jgi:hypothetical protein